MTGNKSHSKGSKKAHKKSQRTHGMPIGAIEKFIHKKASVQAIENDNNNVDINNHSPSPIKESTNTSTCDGEGKKSSIDWKRPHSVITGSTYKHLPELNTFLCSNERSQSFSFNHFNHARSFRNKYNILGVKITIDGSQLTFTKIAVEDSADMAQQKKKTQKKKKKHSNSLIKKMAIAPSDFHSYDIDAKIQSIRNAVRCISLYFSIYHVPRLKSSLCCYYTVNAIIIISNY